MPLPNSRLIHPDFHENLRASAAGAAGMPDHGAITRAATGDGTYDADDNWQPPAPTLIVEGRCRVQPEPTQDRIVIVGDRAVTLHRYRSSWEHDIDQVLVDDVVTLDRSADTQLVGRPLVVRDVVYDTFQIRRYLLLEDHPDQPSPEV